MQTCSLLGSILCQLTILFVQLLNAFTISDLLCFLCSPSLHFYTVCRVIASIGSEQTLHSIFFENKCNSIQCLRIYQ